MNGVRFYEFGEFRLDSRRRILFKNAEQIPVSARIFDLLLVLVQNEGRILEHDELLDKIWGDTFVEQSNLKKSISALRHILGENASEGLYVKTIPRRGYSFVAPVRALPDEVETAAIYRETETEVTIEEIIEEEDAPVIEIRSTAPALLPAAAPQGFFTKLKTYRIAFAVAAGLLILTAVFFVVQSLRSKPTINYSVENVRAKRLTNEGNLGNFAPLSPDGNYLAYPVYFGEQGSLWLKQVETGSVARLTPVMAAQFWAYHFSPDGNYVYYIINHAEAAQSGVYRIPTLGGAPQKLFDTGGGGIPFAPDGSRFAFSRQTEDKTAIELVTAKADGSDLRRVFVLPNNKFLASINWSPDNVHLLYSIRERVGEKVFGYVAETPWNGDAAAPVETMILDKKENQVVLNANWLPDKSSMLLSVREPNADICQIWQYFPATGERRRVTNDDNSYRTVSLTRDGRTLSTVQQNWQSQIWADENGAFDFQPIANLKNLSEVSWTKDGRIIYETPENRQATIWSSSADGSEKRQLTDGNDGIYLYPSLSQNGDYVTFLSNRSGSSQIWRINLDGGDPKQLTNNQGNVTGESKLLSDGQTLLFTSHTYQSGWNLQKQTVDGKVTALTKAETGSWRVSPDEKWLAVELKDEKTKKYRVHVRSLEGDEDSKVFDFSTVRQLSWTRDGKSLVYISPKENADELILQPLDGMPAKVLTSTRGEKIHGFDWSFDGTKLLILRAKNASDAFLIKAQEN